MKRKAKAKNGDPSENFDNVEVEESWLKARLKELKDTKKELANLQAWVSTKQAERREYDKNVEIMSGRYQAALNAVGARDVELAKREAALETLKQRVHYQVEYGNQLVHRLKEVKLDFMTRGYDPNLSAVARNVYSTCAKHLEYILTGLDKP